MKGGRDDGLEGDIVGCGDEFGRFKGTLLRGLEFAVDSDVGILIEMSVGFEAGFGLLSLPEDTEVMPEETDAPLDTDVRVVVLQGMRALLGNFDEFAIGYAGSRPGLGEMVGIELEEVFVARTATDDDVFAVFLALFDRVHSSAKGIDTFCEGEIPHAL